MSANSIFLVILAVSIVGSLILQAAGIRWGLGWAKVADVSYIKALGLLSLYVLAGILLVVLVVVILSGLSIVPSDRMMDCLGYVAQFIASCFVVAVIYKVRPLKAALSLIPLYLVSAAMVLTAIFLVRPLVYEAYVISTNAMAPTLLGVHVKAPCSRCGHLAYGGVPDHFRQFPVEGLLMNCSAEHQAVLVTNVSPEQHDGDRILTCKLISPRRWDLITFRFPQDPSITYVKRLVGLPNEELSIHDGAVWINGERLDPPESLQGIRYSPTIEENGRTWSGPGSETLKLGADEYFVLGDFPEKSSDSRLWEQGAPGYPPYAVPASYITGVVINVYWPPSRWISFR